MTAAVRPTALHWALMLACAGLWGSAFALIETAIETIPPAVVSMGRLWIGAAILIALAAVRAPSGLAAVLTRPRLWPWFLAAGFAGKTLPFLLIPVAQESITSALAGILMAVMPLTTGLFAHVFVPGERLGPRRLLGISLGLAGVAILFGPAALGGLGGAALGAQALMLLAVCGYSTSTILTRLAPAMPAEAFAAGLIFSGALLSTPLGLIAFGELEAPSAASLGAVAVLGVGPTALAGLLAAFVIRTAGPVFFSFNNFVMPIVAVAVGAVFLGERVGPEAILALGVILTGLAVGARASGRPPKSESRPASSPAVYSPTAQLERSGLDQQP